MKRIRNFSIIAHIDHGKSTLADRFIQTCGGLADREMSEQVLDSMDLERERGITIKAQSVSLNYQAKNGEIYQLNLIDTPGHVDFSYEVSRSLAACEGALLVVDAAQGVEAQSVANCYTAIEQGLEVLPIINKIDLPSADAERVCTEIEEIIGIDATDAVRTSAKTGVGVEDVLEAVVLRIPEPEGDPDAPLQALIIDSWFDNYVGVVSLIRIVNGRLGKRDKVRVMSTGRSYPADRVGRFTPKMTDTTSLETGEVGFLVAGIKEIDGAPVGDTLTLETNPCSEPLPGFREVQPRVFAGLFPVSSDDYETFREALQKLKLNDSALHYEPESSGALGFGFRCGFLGMLAHGNRPGAPRAGIRTGTDHHGADRRVRGADDRRSGQLRGQSRASAASPHSWTRFASRSSWPTSWCRRTTWARSSDCAWKNAAFRNGCSTWVDRFRWNTSSPCPRWSWISSTG